MRKRAGKLWENRPSTIHVDFFYGHCTGGNIRNLVIHSKTKFILLTSQGGTFLPTVLPLERVGGWQDGKPCSATSWGSLWVSSRYLTNFLVFNHHTEKSNKTTYMLSTATRAPSLKLRKPTRDRRMRNCASAVSRQPTSCTVSRGPPFHLFPLLLSWLFPWLFHCYFLFCFDDFFPMLFSIAL